MLIDDHPDVLRDAPLLAWQLAGRWHSSPTGCFFVVDLAFFAANALKIPHGGWFPLLDRRSRSFTLMTTWKRGRELVRAAAAPRTRSPLEHLPELDVEPPDRACQGTAVFLTRRRRACRTRCCTT